MKTVLDFFERTSEEYKSMKWLKDKIDDCDDNALTIHYYMMLYNLVINLLKKNKHLEERIEYLERSNNRREETIIELRNEIGGSSE